MPFITEEIYCTLLPEEESIMISDWPVYRDEMDFADAEKAVSSFQEVVRGIRNTRNEMNVPQNRKTNVHASVSFPAASTNARRSFSCSEESYIISGCHCTATANG